MIKKRMSIILITALAALTSSAWAAYAQMGGTGKQGRGQVMARPDAAERLQRMSQSLQLTEEQQAKIKPLLESEEAQVKAIHDDTSLTRQQKMDKAQGLRQTTHGKIMDTLTPEQRKKLDALREKAKERQQGQRKRMPTPPQQAPQ